jgi:hypothetical protein
MKRQSSKPKKMDEYDKNKVMEHINSVRKSTSRFSRTKASEEIESVKFHLKEIENITKGKNVDGDIQEKLNQMTSSIEK